MKSVEYTVQGEVIFAFFSKKFQCSFITNEILLQRKIRASESWFDCSIFQNGRQGAAVKSETEN